MKFYIIFSLLFFQALYNSISANNDKELLMELDKVLKDQKIYEQYMEDKIKTANQKVFLRQTIPSYNSKH